MSRRKIHGTLCRLWQNAFVTSSLLSVRLIAFIAAFISFHSCRLIGGVTAHWLGGASVGPDMTD